VEDHERVKILESYGTKGSYCSYISGHCAVGHDVKLCAKRNPVECRNCRQKNEKEAQ